MKKLVLVISYWLLVAGVNAQTAAQKIQTAFRQFEDDPQLKNALSSLYVIDAATGEVVFDKNSQVGLAGASTQKIVTAATAFELLGKDFRYKTELGYFGKLKHDTLDGWLSILGTGDPTFGSWRYGSTKDSVILYKWSDALKSSGITKVRGYITYDTRRFTSQTIPDGWIWQDIGNYYGAPADVLNWRENQVDIILRSGNVVGGPVEIVSPNWGFINELKSAAKGTGDNAYVYKNYVIAGTIPIGESSFKITASYPDAIPDFIRELGEFFVSKGIRGNGLTALGIRYPYYDSLKDPFQLINAHYSPSLDSITYWFLKKSVNLYGEALVKTFAYERQGFGSTDSGVAIVRKFWKEKGIDENELNIYDGSGLSPLNRLTTHAQVEILKFAKTRDWFPYFYDALPEFNGMKMKSGTISDVKGFCGYQKSKDGHEYIFSFLINNYNGRTSEVVSKMYKVLDILK
jgi:D-alanyl-D-alanine carboxypeptidase/D-alanyl-D-alanine-endopeptidase (penicillin-binding protein 4)